MPSPYALHHRDIYPERYRPTLSRRVASVLMDALGGLLLLILILLPVFIGAMLQPPPNM